MSKLSRFIGMSKEVEVRGETIKLYSITVKDMGIMDRLAELGSKGEKEKLSEAEENEIAELGRRLLKLSYPEENFTDEEINGMDIDLYADLYGLVMNNVYESKDGKGLNRIRELKEKAIQQNVSK
jgi:hypothetical protein